MILADTSVWVGHFRRPNGALMGLLHDGQVLVHPFVVGELACGNLRNRDQILSLLGKLPSAVKAGDEESLSFVARHRLAGRGMGLVDVQLLASCLLSRCSLWTLDKRLAHVAREMGIGVALAAT